MMRSLDEDDRTLRPRSGTAWIARRAVFSWSMLFGLPPLITGCGTNLQQVLLETGDALGRTFLDIILTDVTNTIAGVAGTTPPPADNVDTGSGGGSPGGGSTGTLPDNLVGDPVSGEMVFGANGCESCHCADAGGGCALNAPRIVGVAADTVNERLRGTINHPIKPDVSDQDVVDLAAFLDSLP